MMKVAFFSSKSYDQEYFSRMNEDFGHDLHYFETRLDSQTVQIAKGFDVICAFVNDKVDEKTLKKMGRWGIRLLALRNAGFNNVDIKAAERNGITILRVPAYSPEAVAEHSLALILTLNRKTHKAYNRVREGNFSLERLVGFNISGKNVGVIGTGTIGKAFIRLLKGFNNKILAHDPYPDTELEKQGIKYVSLEELLVNSDIVSLHCPLTPQTHHMINAKTLEFFKQGSMLINTSRGKLIDTESVIRSLREKRLGSLGIDVYAEEEKLFFKDLSEMIIDDDIISRLISLPNVLITSHQAFLTHEALEQIAVTTLQNISDFEKGTLKRKNEVSSELLQQA
jgi:D-lactate dehydrogenase